MAYQIFISYRRKCESWVAELLKDQLTALGYNVFLDIDSLYSGKWEDGIESALDEISDFIVVLAPGSLQRCVNPEDVMRKEIEYALEKGKNIIPVMWNGFEKPSAFGEDIPQTVCSVFKYNAINNANDLSLIRANIKKLISFLSAKPENVSVQKSRKADGYTAEGSRGYNPAKVSETRRLHLQSQYSEELDRKCFAQAKKLIGRKEGLVALDIGCADGFTTRLRLNKKNGFAKVIGIDRSIDAVSSANAADNKGVYSYYNVNVENEDFEEHLRAIMQMNEVESFDVIYTAFTLHHLDDPVRVLRIVNQFLSPKGVVIARGVDDGGQLGYGFYPDGSTDMEKSALVDENLELSVKTKGMSKRLHGRQFYSWFKLAGYKTLISEYTVSDTVGKNIEERISLFDYYFKFRKDYTQRQLASDPSNAEFKLHHEKMLENLNELEEAFTEDENFYYMVMSFAMVAQKFLDE